MSSALELKNHLQAEIEKLRRQIREAEEKSQRAEAALKATEQRYRLHRLSDALTSMSASINIVSLNWSIVKPSRRP